LLLVTKIDRCSRNTLEFLKLQERLYKKGVRFISLDLPYSSDMAVNQLISTNLAAIATFENERRKDRQRQGIQAAKKNGKYFGRKTVIDKKLISQVQDLKENKNLSITENCKITDWQAAKHIYHANGMGIDPADYGFTQQELERIRGESGYKEGGLIAYARRGFHFNMPYST
jgi:hypothetical protein